MAKVVSLRGKEILPPGTPRPKVVKLLRELLERAESGDVSAITVVCLHSDDTYSTWHEGRMLYGLVGAIECHKQRIIAVINDD